MDVERLYSTAQARALDAAAERYGIESYELMQRAGRAAFRVLRERHPLAQRIAVLAGPGNNGGDGYVLARLLHEAGRAVAVVAPLGPPRGGDAARAYAEWCALGAVNVGAELPPAELYVDALFGIGLRRPPEGAARTAIEALECCARPVLALDVPSGVDADTGAVPGVAVRASTTLSFIVAKFGLCTGAAVDHVGELVLDDLGVPPALLAEQPPLADVLAPRQLVESLPRRRRDSHKGTHGRVLIVGGEHGTGGAVLLAAAAALRGGTGSVAVATRWHHVPALLARHPEVLAAAVDRPEQLDPLLAAAQAVVLGPGLGTAAWGLALAERVLAAGRPTLLDADALNLLAAGRITCPAGAILTPHPGEASRLLASTTAAVQSDRRAALERLVERYAAVVVLKGAGSMVGAPGLRPAVCRHGNPGLAVAGSGDVLAGLIGALLAQGLEPPTAARLGVLVHALAGDECARRFGERGVLPSELPSEFGRWLNPSR